MNSWPQLKYHKVQHALWTSPARFVWACAGRQSGKTEISLRRLAAYLPIKKPWPDPLYVYAGPTFAQAKRTAWQRLLKLIPEQWIADISLSELTITSIFGSKIIVTGLDKPQRLEGLMIDGVVLDENSDLKPEAYKISVGPTLVTRRGWCWKIGVPKRFGIGAELYREEFEKALTGTIIDSAAFTWGSEGIVPAAELERERQTLDEKDYQELYEASWLSAAGGIFHAWDSTFNVRPCIYDPDKALIVSSDFNIRHPMSWVIMQDHAGVTVVIDELFLRDTNTPATLEELMRRWGHHKAGFQFYGDASGRARHTSAAMSDYVHIASHAGLQALGRTMHYTTSNPPVADRFAATNARICNGNGNRNLFVDPKCSNLIRDLNTRSFRPGTRDTDDTGDQGHATDALGYYLYSRFPLQLSIQNSNVVTINMGTR